MPAINVYLPINVTYLPETLIICRSLSKMVPTQPNSISKHQTTRITISPELTM